MKIVIPTITLALLLVGCGVPKEKFEALQTELATVKSQLATNQAALASTNAAFVEQTKALESSQAQTAATRSLLEIAQAEITKLTPLAEKALTLPIEISTRKALTGQGSVLQLLNTSHSPLPVTVKAHSVNFGDKGPKGFILTPGVKEQVGKYELLDFLPGDTAEITSVGFSPMVFKF